MRLFVPFLRRVATGVSSVRALRMAAGASSRIESTCSALLERCSSGLFDVLVDSTLMSATLSSDLLAVWLADGVAAEASS